MPDQTTTTEPTADRRCFEIDNHDGNPPGPVTTVEIDNDSVTLTRKTRDPTEPPETIECARTTTRINQYILINRRSRLRARSMSALNHCDRVFILGLSGGDWTLYRPREKPKPRGHSAAYAPTQVPGVTVKTVSQTRGGRGLGSRSHLRYKLGRGVVYEHGETWLIQLRREKGGTPNGSYNRVVDPTATLLRLADETDD